jgi:hypothetical protein
VPDDLVKDKLESEQELNVDQVEKKSKAKSIFDLWFEIREFYSLEAKTSLIYGFQYIQTICIPLNRLYTD